MRITTGTCPHCSEQVEWNESEGRYESQGNKGCPEHDELHNVTED